MCVNYLFMLLIRLPIKSRLLAVKYLGSQKLYADFLLRVSVPLISHVVQGSTVYPSE